MTEIYVNLQVHRKNVLNPLGFFLGIGIFVSVVSHLLCVCLAMTLLYVVRGSARGRNAADGAREEKVLSDWRGRSVRGTAEAARPIGRIDAAEAILMAVVASDTGVRVSEGKSGEDLWMSWRSRRAPQRTGSMSLQAR